MRLAHFSDIHLTHSPFREGGLLGKRLIGTFNRIIGGRGKHFAEVDLRIQALLADIDTQQVDHAICTGDVTQMSYPAEFEAVAALFGEQRLKNARFFTVLPGNHDRYTKKTADTHVFEHYFGALCENGQFPFQKRIAKNTLFIGLDVARACSLLDSSGLCGAEQLSALRSLLLKVDRTKDRIILGMHYGLLTAEGKEDKAKHGLRDAHPLMQLLLKKETKVDLILHGHLHDSYTHLTGFGKDKVLSSRSKESLCIREICAGSATDLHKECTYNIIDIAEDRRELTLYTRSFQNGAYRSLREKTLSF